MRRIRHKQKSKQRRSGRRWRERALAIEISDEACAQAGAQSESGDSTIEYGASGAEAWTEDYAFTEQELLDMAEAQQERNEK